MFRHWGLFLLTLIIGAMLAFMAATPPAPKPIDTSANQFSAERAMQDVSVIAAKPHPTGSLENEKVRAYLVDRMTELGMEVSISERQLGERALARLNSWSGNAKTKQPIFNVIGVLRSEFPSAKALLLMAHHDTVWGSPGAADDTIGIASIFEIVRALSLEDKRQRDIIVLLTDAEELGLVGAREFFAKHPMKDSVGVIINLEARGGGGTANMFQTSRENGAATKLFAKTVSQPSASSLATFIYNALPNDTDLTPALKGDYTAYNIANIGDAQFYHSPAITIDALSQRTLQHMGAQGLDLSRALVTAKELPGKSTDAVFFDVFGLFTLHYSAILGWVMIAISTACFIAAYLKDRQPKQIVKGAIKTIGFFVLGGVGLYVLNIISGSGSSGYYDRLAAIHKLEVVALAFSAALFVLIFCQKNLSVDERIGAVMPIFFLGIAGQVIAPTASYFLIIPAMLFAISLFVQSRETLKTFSPIIALVTASLVTGYMLYLGHSLMLGVGPYMMPIAILTAAIGAMGLVQVSSELSKTSAYAIASAGFALSLGMALWVRFDPIASTIPLY